jgi:methyl-accepting chemotaxis protein
MLRKMKIAPRLILAFSLLCLLTIIVGGVAMFRFSETEQQFDNIADRRLPAALLTGELSRAFLMTRLYTMNAMYAADDTERQQHMSFLRRVIQQYDETAKQLELYHKTAAGAEVMTQVNVAKQRYDSQHHQLLLMMQQGDIAKAEQFRRSGFNQLSLDVTAAIEALAAYQQSTAAAASELARHSISTAYSSMIVIMIIALLAGAVLAAFFSRSLTLPLHNAVIIAQRVAGGDLSHSFTDTEPDEAGDMIRALQQMQANLQKTINDINLSSSQLAATSEELSTVTEQSTVTLHQQSEELELAATAVTELTTAIEEVARNAASTSRNSELADEKARQGTEQVNNTISTMTQLEAELGHTRSGIENLAGGVKKISSVLDVIRAIAEQTNLLALNAAIEAARAGESGRGFAVVADEVRALAHRTQESTKEIEQMMHQVQADTGHSVDAMQQSSIKARDTLKLAQQAGDALQLIAEAVSQINDQNLTIASAAEEQATVAREVDRNLVNIRDLAVQTSSGANETQASGAELARLAVHLNQLVCQFRV